MRDKAMDEARWTVLIGTVIELKPNFNCIVHLETGEQVRARIPKATAQRMFRVLPGDRVQVEIREKGQYVIRGFETQKDKADPLKG
jgi:translation initiation factor IF-1